MEWACLISVDYTTKGSWTGILPGARIFPSAYGVIPSAYIKLTRLDGTQWYLRMSVCLGKHTRLQLSVYQRNKKIG